VQWACAGSCGVRLAAGSQAVLASMLPSSGARALLPLAGGEVGVLRSDWVGASGARGVFYDRARGHGVTLAPSSPSSVSLCAGDSTTLSVSASGGPGLTYQWL